jgi:hypothetical protein
VNNSGKLYSAVVVDDDRLPNDLAVFGRFFHVVMTAIVGAHRRSMRWRLLGAQRTR